MRWQCLSVKGDGNSAQHWLSRSETPATDLTASVLALTEQSVTSISVHKPCCTMNSRSIATEVADALRKHHATPATCGRDASCLTTTLSETQIVRGGTASCSHAIEPIHTADNDATN